MKMDNCINELHGDNVPKLISIRHLLQWWWHPSNNNPFGEETKAQTYQKGIKNYWPLLGEINAELLGKIKKIQGMIWWVDVEVYESLIGGSLNRY